METTNLRCKTCGATLTEDDVNQELQYTQCSRCGSIFGPGAWKALRTQLVRRAMPPIPDDITITTEPTELTIAYRKRGDFVVELITTCVFGAMTLVGIRLQYETLLIFEQKGRTFETVWGSIAMALMTLFVAWMFYNALTRAFNTTTIHARLGLLQVRRTPIPEFAPLMISALHARERDILAEQLEQIYVKERIGHTRRGGRVVSYYLMARLTDGEDIQLLRVLNSPEVPLYLEQELERYLDIEDRPVEGEHKSRKA